MLDVSVYIPLVFCLGVGIPTTLCSGIPHVDKTCL